jgi:hypothetical protein
MLRIRFHIFGIDSIKFDRPIAATAQEDLIDILIVAGMEISLEEDLGRFERDA